MQTSLRTLARTSLFLTAFAPAAILTTACGKTTAALPTAPSAVAAGVTTGDAGSTAITALKEGGHSGSSSTSSSQGSLNSGRGRGSDDHADDLQMAQTPTTTPPSTTPTPAPQSDDHSRSLEQVEGVVTLVAGACPATTFTVADRLITTTVDTDFQRGACAEVLPLVRVHVAGRVIAGLFTASTVRIQGPTLKTDLPADAPDDDSPDADDAPPVTPPAL